MNKGLAWQLLVLAGSAALLAGAGCATRGYVRSQVAGMQTSVSQQVDQVQKDLTSVRNTAEQASARADQAFGAAGNAQEMALGNIGYKDVTQATVNFAFNSDKLNDEAFGTLDGLVKQIQDRPELLVDIYGFTDNRGPEPYNNALGLRRAQAVERYLADRTPDQLPRYAAISYGESKQVGDASTRQGRADNRRVVVALVERVPPSGVEPAEGQTSSR